MKGNNPKNQKQKIVNTKNLLESISDIGSQAVSTSVQEVKNINQEFIRQLLNQQKSEVKRSGEISKGESLLIDHVTSGQSEKNKKLQEQIFFERRLFSEEKRESSKKVEELRVRLQALMSEANKLIASTNNLSESIRSAVMQNPAETSNYQINFFESVISLISSFRKKIDQALVWFNQTNKRTEKKNYWSQYKKKGASFLLSGESYSQRSAG